MRFRFVDRDMVMRYYWGMGVGHAYSHEQTAIVPTALAATQIPNMTADANSEAVLEPQVPDQDCEFDCDSEDSELGLDNREDDWTDIEEYSEDELSRVEEEEELIIDMDDMDGFSVYGPGS